MTALATLTAITTVMPTSWPREPAERALTQHEVEARQLWTLRLVITQSREQSRNLVSNHAIS